MFEVLWVFPHEGDSQVYRVQMDQLIEHTQYESQVQGLQCVWILQELTW